MKVATHLVFSWVGPGQDLHSIPVLRVLALKQLESFTTLIVTHLNCSIAKDLLEDRCGEEGEDGQDNRKGGCKRDFKLVYSVICDWWEF